jgi:hypothetical protein
VDFFLPIGQEKIHKKFFLPFSPLRRDRGIREVCAGKADEFDFSDRF